MSDERRKNAILRVYQMYANLNYYDDERPIDEEIEQIVEAVFASTVDPLDAELTAALARAEQAEQMLSVSEEHCEFWKARAEQAEKALRDSWRLMLRSRRIARAVLSSEEQEGKP
jgi:hypothetical protein